MYGSLMDGKADMIKRVVNVRCRNYLEVIKEYSEGLGFMISLEGLIGYRMSFF